MAVRRPVSKSILIWSLYDEKRPVGGHAPVMRQTFSPICRKDFFGWDIALCKIQICSKGEI